MVRSLRSLILIFILLPGITVAQEIALTFDDAPTADSPLLTGTKRTRLIIRALRKNNVDEAAFFVLTQNIDEPGEQRLRSYAGAGHLLANHSHSHQRMHQIGTAAYIEDIRTSDSILSRYANYHKWYRYPYLDEGRKISSRDSVREALEGLRLQNGYVTVDNYDWYLNSLAVNARKKNQHIDRKALKEVYIEHIYNSVLFYDDVAVKHLGRSPKHVLLLHENDLAALFLGDLIKHLKKNGWKIISPRDAYLDPIASHRPDVLFNGQGRVAAIAREQGTPAMQLVQKSEDEVFLDEVVQKRNVFK